MEYSLEEFDQLASTIAQYGGTRPAQEFTRAAWGGLAMLVLLFVASTVYVAFGGAFALEASPIPEGQVSVADVAPSPASADSAAQLPVAASISALPSEYFPAAYPNRGRDGNGNVMTYEHD